MSVPFSPFEPPICAGHAEFDARLAELVARARACDWHRLDEHWHAFADDMGHHLDYEETELFVEFARESRAQADVASGLRSDHDRLRALLRQLGWEIQAKALSSETVQAFIDKLRTHAEREEQSLYPCLEQRRGVRFRTRRTPDPGPNPPHR